MKKLLGMLVDNDFRKDKKKLPTLKEVMKGIKKGDFEGELDWGPDVGKEILEPWDGPLPGQKKKRCSIK
jgi:hypothetical protein